MSHIQTVALFGASGNIGKGIAAALLANPSRPANLVAVARNDSTSTFAPEFAVRKADFEDRASLAAALKGVDAVVITLPFTAGMEMELRIIDAAADAGARYVVPNQFGSDTAHPAVQEIPINGTKSQALQRAQERGITYFAMITNPWYEYAFPGAAFGIDIKNRVANLWDDGTSKSRLSTMANPGRAVAALLSAPKSAASGASLDKYANKHVYTSDVYASQRDILDAAQRATGTTDKDWTITYTPLLPLIEEGKAAFFAGDHMNGLFKWLYGLMFVKGVGDYADRDLANQDLGLQPADLDAVTKSVAESLA